MKKLVTMATMLAIMGFCFAQDQYIYEEMGYSSLFNGEDLSGWIVPEGDNGHWSVIDGVIDYDARSEAKQSKDLWSEKEYHNFVLHIEWRFKGYGDHLFRWGLLRWEDWRGSDRDRDRSRFCIGR